MHTVCGQSLFHYLMNTFDFQLFLFCRTSGVTDYYAVDDFHALHQARQCVKNLNFKKTLPVSSFYSTITTQNRQVKRFSDWFCIVIQLNGHFCGPRDVSLLIHTGFLFHVHWLLGGMGAGAIVTFAQEDWIICIHLLCPR